MFDLVFITLRFGEAKAEGIKLKTALAERGISAYMDATGTGEDIFGNIAKALDGCKLAVILGTETYGIETGGVFDTDRELSAILGNKIPYVLVKMCKEFKVPKAKFTFNGNTIGFIKWMPGEEMPPTLVDSIVKRLEQLEVSVNGGSPAPTSAKVQLDPPLSALVSKHFPDDDDAKNITEVLIKNRYQKAAKLQQVEVADLFDELKLNGFEKKHFQRLYAELKGGAAESGAAASGAAESGGGGGGGGGGASKAEALRQVVAKFNITESDLDKGDPAKSGNTLLHKAAGEGRVDDMRLLLQAGATVDSRNNDDWTPLMNAAVNGKVDAAKLLVEAGADRNAKDRRGNTALARARQGASYGIFDKSRLPDVERALTPP